MSWNDGNNVPVHTAHIYRQSSLPTYEEATGTAPITDYTEVTLEAPELTTGNKKYVINIYNSHHGHSQTTNISDINSSSRNGDQDRLIQENHIRAADSLCQTSLQDCRRERLRKPKIELKLFISVGVLLLFCIFVMIFGKRKAVD